MNIQTGKTGASATAVDIKRILQMIPHRYPMLMVDRVTEMRLDHSATGIKNSSAFSMPSSARCRPTKRST